MRLRHHVQRGGVAMMSRLMRGNGASIRVRLLLLLRRLASRSGQSTAAGGVDRRGCWRDRQWKPSDETVCPSHPQTVGAKMIQIMPIASPRPPYISIIFDRSASIDRFRRHYQFAPAVGGRPSSNSRKMPGNVIGRPRAEPALPDVGRRPSRLPPGRVKPPTRRHP